MTQINIDQQTYELESLSDVARQHISQLQVVDAEIQHLQVQQMIAQTARAAIFASLKAQLPHPEQ
ncbi:DUF6447 family protein [Telmatospirillum sp.]|uniref:DUF6447 family protein n=1 Tax=Telmatospirillum sp. TaxID=2079197 RepID=UPI0028435C86|nr:DUF6447 family protein [Telmatospirillum sp.]MDR3435671.1 DUF6447 family protein [Telmatospirillum sp.]